MAVVNRASIIIELHFFLFSTVFLLTLSRKYVILYKTKENKLKKTNWRINIMRELTKSDSCIRLLDAGYFLSINACEGLEEPGGKDAYWVFAMSPFDSNKKDFDAFGSTPTEALENVAEVALGQQESGAFH